MRKHKWGSKILSGSRGYHAEDNRIGVEAGLPKDMEAEVFMHEIMHAIYYTFNVNKIASASKDADEMEESIVTAFSTALCTVFVQNPWLLAYFQQTLLTKH